MLPEKVRLLDVAIGDTERAGQLIKGANYEFRYVTPEPEQPQFLLSPAGG